MDIYRFMSFFELFHLIVHKKLKLTKLELMDDKNEGIFNALSAQLPHAFNLGFSKTHQEIIDYHNQIKQNTYISCWTKVKDSMAMWLLYSSDKMSIRVKTNKEKLEKYLDIWMEKNFWTNHTDSPAGTLQTFYPKSKIKEVKYININEKISQIKKLHLKEKKERERILKKYSKSEDFPDNKDYLKEFSLMREDILKEAKQIIDEPIFYKDKAYEFESEVRAVIEVGIRNNESWEDLEKRENDIDFIMGTSTFEFGKDFYNSKFYPNILLIDVEDDFIEEICFDPRMPKFKREVFEEILSIDKSLIVESDVFGYIGEKQDFTMEYW